MNNFVLWFGWVCVVVLCILFVVIAMAWTSEVWKRIANFRDAKELLEELHKKGDENADLKRKIAELETRLGYR